MNRLVKWLSSLSAILLLAACQGGETQESRSIVLQESNEQVLGSDNSAVGKIKLDGLAEHYHTGDEIELSASAENEVEAADWNWYTRNNDEAEWKVISGLNTELFSREATADGLQIKAALIDNDGLVIAESESAQVAIDDHHGSDEETRRIYNGFFYNTEISDRELSDWEGDWQSVYPYLLSGDLDEVFEEKSAQSESMSFEEYKEYYTIGYETNINRITIEDNHFTFFYADGKEMTAEYEYDGYDILEYEKGNRGVRFVYSRVGESEEMPQYIQFSDHLIAPKESSHYHLYWGNNRDELLDEVINWPTYYPNDLDADEIVREMLAH